MGDIPGGKIAKVSAVRTPFFKVIVRRKIRQFFEGKFSIVNVLRRFFKRVFFILGKLFRGGNVRQLLEEGIFNQLLTDCLDNSSCGICNSLIAIWSCGVSTSF